MEKITLGSLFDGIGVFPLAATLHGITPIWASEIEKAPISITRRHFPDMEHLGDITKLDGGKIPAVHVLTFGSPCQNLSQIGNRTGLAGAKSSLFYQAIRIIKEMRDATDGRFPVIAVWENVMGSLSSSDRLDFAAVLRAFTDADIPIPASGGWAHAGMVRGRGPDLCWRLMDAQYWARCQYIAPKEGEHMAVSTIKTYFCRKPRRLSDLQKEQYQGPIRVQVEKVIQLTQQQFEYFLSHIWEDMSFLSANKRLTDCDTRGVNHCLLVTTRDIKGGILVDCQGYDYYDKCKQM